jgi:hypothetical protein
MMKLIVILGALGAFSLAALPSASAHPVRGHHHTSLGQASPIPNDGWREPDGYEPCPAQVVMADGRPACLGLPD